MRRSFPAVAVAVAAAVAVAFAVAGALDTVLIALML